MADDVEQNETADKLRFVNRDGEVYLLRGAQELWIGPSEEACEAMTEFLAELDYCE